MDIRCKKCIKKDNCNWDSFRFGNPDGDRLPDMCGVSNILIKKGDKLK